MNENEIILDKVEEYSEGMDVSLVKTTGRSDFDITKEQNVGKGRIVVKALNEAGHNCTQVDLEQLLEWVAKNKFDLYDKYYPHDNVL